MLRVKFQMVCEFEGYRNPPNFHLGVLAAYDRSDGQDGGWGQIGEGSEGEIGQGGKMIFDPLNHVCMQTIFGAFLNTEVCFDSAIHPERVLWSLILHDFNSQALINVWSSKVEGEQGQGLLLIEYSLLFVKILVWPYLFFWEICWLLSLCFDSEKFSYWMSMLRFFQLST